MNGQTLADLLWFRTWWTYPRADGVPWVDGPYHAFNLVEGVAWLACVALVLGRYARRRRSGLEVAYALAFAAFGLTDFREAYALTSWLLWVKGFNLGVLLWVRSIVLGRYYPESKLY